MSERLEQWKVREKIRDDVFWAAIWIGLWGAMAIVAGALQVAGIGSLRIVDEGVPAALGVPLAFAVGIALLLCARGLWNASAWARWVSAALFAALSLAQVMELIRGRSIPLNLLFTLPPAVYLLLPSTGQRFARARGRARPEPHPGR